MESGGGRLTTSEGGVFQINSSTGAIRVIGSLDYETTPRYELTASVLYDADGDPRTTTDEVTRDVQVVIDVGNVLIELADANGDPVTSYTGSVNEDGTSPDLPRIRASVDSPAQDSTIRYEFVRSGSPVGTTDREFRIDASNGTISVAGNLDYETTPRYELTVSVLYDADGDPRTTTDEVTRDVQVVIDVGNVIDQSEDIILMQDGAAVPSYTASVDEDASAGSSVVTISASVDNAAQGSIIEYGFLESGGGRLTTSEGGVFQINSSTGAISVADSSLLDYETTPRYELTVSVLYDADGDPRTTTDEVTRDVQVVINVNDVEGIRLKNVGGDVVDSYTAPVDEDAAADTEVVTIDASVDGAPQVSVIEYNFFHSNSFSILSEGNVFQIDTNTGAITVSGLGSLDFDTTPLYELTVRVLYDADNDLTTTNVTRNVQVVITVNDPDEQASPAIIPDRQAFAHQDSYDPDDLGLTPMPDADPSAG